MTKGHGVVWKEGIALLPQHFQQQDAINSKFLMGAVATANPFYWGFSHLAIDSQLLAAGNLRVVEAQGYFKDGTRFDILEDGEPTPLKIEPSTRPIAVYLGLPHPSAQRPACSEDAEATNRFNEEYVTTKDSFSSNTSVETIAVKKPNYKLLTGADDISGYQTIPLGVATCLADTGAIALRQAFVPPLLDYKASPFLKGIVKELLSSFEKKGRGIAEILSEGSLESRISWEEVFYLRSINKVLTELRSFNQTKRGYHPYGMFCALQSAVADLATICEKSRIAPEIEPYDHDDICHSFTSLVIKLREYLRKVITQKVYRFPLTKEQLGYWTCQISNAAFFTEYDLFIEVCQKNDGQMLTDKILTLLRASNLDEIETMRKSNTKGLRLVAIPTPPIYLPAKKNAEYFKISKSGEDWNRLVQSSGIGIHFASHLDQVDINLYAVKL